MEVDKETEKQIQELQLLEQNLQNILMQKQAFQLELAELENAVAELKNSEGDVYKIVGRIMIKASKNDLEKEMAQKQELMSARVKMLDSQEKKVSDEIEKLRKKVLGKIQK